MITYNANTVFLKPEAVHTALIIIIGIVLIREYILHIRRMNLSRTFTGHTTYWPSVTINRYKVFGFMAITAVLINSSIFISQIDYVRYVTIARNISGENKITYYSSEGIIAGSINSSEKSSLWNIRLYDSPELITSQCSAKISVPVRPDGGRIFLYSGDCLKQLTDGIYYIHLYPSGQENNQILLRLRIRNGSLSEQ